MADIQVKRVYEPAAPQDGYRVLVDRLWPRGFTKEKMHADLWLKEIAPSNDLRNWYHLDRSMWDEFKRRYYAELDSKPEIVALLLEKAKSDRLTLLFAARDVEYNQAIVLRDYLLDRSATRPG